MVDLEDIKRAAHIEKDKQGHPVVQIPLELWESWIAHHNISSEDVNQWENTPWTADELREMLTFKPASGAEIIDEGLTGAWRDMGITNSLAWVEEIRRKAWGQE